MNTGLLIKIYYNYNIVCLLRGASHVFCNLQKQLTKKTSLFFHNGANYDFHLLLQDLCDFPEVIR